MSRSRYDSGDRSTDEPPPSNSPNAAEAWKEPQEREKTRSKLTRPQISITTGSESNAIRTPTVRATPSSGRGYGFTQTLGMMASPTPKNYTNSNGVGEVIAPKLLRDKPKKRPTTPARRHVVDWLLGSRTGQYFAVGLSYPLLVLWGVACWRVSGGTDNYPTTMYTCFWMSYSLIFDPGTQTGLWEGNDDTPGVALVMAGLISIVGFVYMLLVLGMVVESIRALLSWGLRTRSRFAMSGHIVILGWSDKTVYLLKEMFLQADNRGSDRQQVIILANCDEHEMKQAIRDHCGSLSQWSASRHRVYTRKGCPYEKDELCRVSIGSASDIIVLGTPGASRDSDLEVVRVILGLAALPDTDSKGYRYPALSGRVIAEVKCADTAPVLEALLVPDPQTGLGATCESIHARSTVNRMLCLMAVKPLVGDILATLSSFDDREEIYCIRKPEGMYTFGDACEFFKQAICVGVIKKGSDCNGSDSPGKVVLAPDDDEELGESDRLLLIAESEVSILAGNSLPPPEEGIPCPGGCGYLVTWHPTHCCGRCATGSGHGDRCERKKIHLRRKDAFFRTLTAQGAGLAQATKRTSRRFLLTGEASCDEAGTESIECSPPLSSPLLGQDRSGRIYIIIGWPDDFQDFLMAFDKYVRKGTSVHILTQRPEESRSRCKAHPSWHPVNIELFEHYGSSVSVDRLITLPLSDASAILIMAEDCFDGSAASDSPALGGQTLAMSCDSATVTCAVMICNICEGRYKGKSRRRVGRIICEVLDPRTDRMLNRNRELKKKVKFFCSNALETGLFAMASSDPIIFNTLVLLLSPTHDIGKLVTEPVSHYAPEEIRACDSISTVARESFRDLAKRVRETQGDLLLGWHRLKDGRTKLACELEDRDDLEEFSEKDRLLILQRPRGNIPRALGGTNTPGHKEEFRIWRDGCAVTYAAVRADLAGAGLDEARMRAMWMQLQKAPFSAGDTVRIVKPNTPSNGCTGVVTDPSRRGQVNVEFCDADSKVYVESCSPHELELASDEADVTFSQSEEVRRGGFAARNAQSASLIMLPMDLNPKAADDIACQAAGMATLPQAVLEFDRPPEVVATPLTVVSASAVEREASTLVVASSAATES